MSEVARGQNEKILGKEILTLCKEVIECLKYPMSLIFPACTDTSIKLPDIVDLETQPEFLKSSKYASRVVSFDREVLNQFLIKTTRIKGLIDDRKKACTPTSNDRTQIKKGESNKLNTDLATLNLASALVEFASTYFFQSISPEEKLQHYNSVRQNLVTNINYLKLADLDVNNYLFVNEYPKLAVEDTDPDLVIKKLAHFSFILLDYSRGCISRIVKSLYLAIIHCKEFTEIEKIFRLSNLLKHYFNHIDLTLTTEIISYHTSLQQEYLGAVNNQINFLFSFGKVEATTSSLSSWISLMCTNHRYLELQNNLDSNVFNLTDEQLPYFKKIQLTIKIISGVYQAKPFYEEHPDILPDHDKVLQDLVDFCFSKLAIQDYRKPLDQEHVNEVLSCAYQSILFFEDPGYAREILVLLSRICPNICLFNNRFLPTDRMFILGGKYNHHSIIISERAYKRNILKPVIVAQDDSKVVNYLTKLLFLETTGADSQYFPNGIPKRVEIIQDSVFFSTHISFFKDKLETFICDILPEAEGETFNLGNVNLNEEQRLQVQDYFYPQIAYAYIFAMTEWSIFLKIYDRLVSTKDDINGINTKLFLNKRNQIVSYFAFIRYTTEILSGLQIELPFLSRINKLAEQLNLLNFINLPRDGGGGGGTQKVPAPSNSPTSV